MKSLAAVLCVSVSVMFAGSASAQQYPSQPIHVIVAAAAGGITDLFARQLGAKVEEDLKQTVIVDNRPGGDAVIATQQAARAAPNGYTIYLITDPFGAVVIQHPNVSYNYERDFDPIMILGKSIMFVVASTKAPAKNFKDMMTYAKANPGKVTVATTYVHTRLFAEELAYENGVKLLQVPFKSTPDMQQALLNGEIDFAITSLYPYATYATQGKLAGLAITNDKRVPIMPDTPTFADLGFPNMDYQPFYAIVAPKKTPAAAIETLRASFAKALTDEKVIATLEKAGARPAPSSPAELTQAINADLARWKKVVSETGVKLSDE